MSKRIEVFCEDSGHERVIKPLLLRLFPDHTVDVRIKSAINGKGRALKEFRNYLDDIQQLAQQLPDAIVVAIDANCKGYNKKKKEIDAQVPKNSSFKVPIIHAIPDPHIERWMLIDSKAFRGVFGKGCSAPDRKCEKDKYKKALHDDIRNAGGVITLGWIEYAKDIITRIDIQHVEQQDNSLKKFFEEVRGLQKQWEE